jgi:hypothetical protein
LFLPFTSAAGVLFERFGERALNFKDGMNFLRGATELLSGALKGGPAVCADIGKLQ